MNVKAKMAYHANEYRRLKSLLVRDAGGMEEVKRAERVGNAQLNDLKQYYNYVKSAERQLDGTVKWLKDLATKDSDPQARKLAKECHAALVKNYAFIKKGAR